MVAYNHLELLSRGPVSVVRLLNHKLRFQEEVDELAAEWSVVADCPDCRTLVVDCSRCPVLRSEMLSKLISLERRLKRKEGKLVLCGMRCEARQLLRWTKLDRLFEVKEDTVHEAPARA